MDGVTPDGEDSPTGATDGEADSRWEDDTDPVGFAPIDTSGSGGETESATFVPGFVPVGTSSAEAPSPAPDAPQAPRRGRRGPVLAAVVTLVVLLAAAIVTVSLSRNSHHGSPASAGPAPTTASSGAPGSSGNPLTGPRHGRQAAVFELADGVSAVRVRATTLGEELYRVSVPAGSNLVPRVDREGADVRLLLAGNGKGDRGPVEVALNAGVRWTLRLNGGVDHSVIDMTGGTVAGVELAGGASRIDLTLPRPQRQVPVRMSGGVNQFEVHLAGRTPVRVRVQAGAGRVTLGGATHDGIAPGRSFTANGWMQGAAGVDLVAVAGMATLNVLG